MQLVNQIALEPFACCAPFLDADEGPASELTADLAGICLGSETGTLQLRLLDKDEEAVTSIASHGGPVLQIDYVVALYAFVSISAETLRLWSDSLEVLRELQFPQPMTSVAFRCRSDEDIEAGHGDILLGFASHVESISNSYWMPHWMRGALSGSLQERRDRERMAVEGPDIDGELDGLQRGVSDQALCKPGRGRLKKTAQVLMSGRRATEMMKRPEGPASERWQHGEVLDFRGEPLVETDVLLSARAPVCEELPPRPAGVSSDWARPSAEKMCMYTHQWAGHQEKLVDPRTSLAAPREHGLRGITDAAEVANVTSVGARTGHSKVALRGHATPRARPHSLDGQHQRSGDRDAWRNKLMARGLPAHVNQVHPKEQHCANTKEDTATLLCNRDHIVLVPSLPMEHQLKDMFSSKDTWLYCPQDSEALRERREELKQPKYKNQGIDQWSNNGRRIMGIQEQPPPLYSRKRRELTLPPPMTRSEATEQRLIASARAPPPAPLRMELVPHRPAR